MISLSKFCNYFVPCRRSQEKVYLSHYKGVTYLFSCVICLFLFMSVEEVHYCNNKFYFMYEKLLCCKQASSTSSLDLLFGKLREEFSLDNYWDINLSTSEKFENS